MKTITDKQFKNVNVGSVKEVLREAQFDPREPAMKTVADIGSAEYFEIAALDMLNQARLARVAADRLTYCRCLIKTIHFLVLARIKF